MIDKKIKEFIWGHILMPPNKIRATRQRWELVKELRETSADFDFFFTKAFYKEKREVHMARKFVVMILWVAATLFIIGAWIRWTIIGQSGGFIMTVICLAGAALFLSRIRSFWEVLDKAFWWAEAEARAELKELRAAEQKSQKATAKGQKIKQSETDEKVTTAYVRGAKKRRKKVTGGV